VHCGCAYFVLLVVSGPGRGRLVSVDYDGTVAPYMLEDVDFLAWYERWLDGFPAGRAAARIADTLPGDEADLLAIARSTASREERRARAVFSLIALPALTPAGGAAVAALVSDPSPGVRRNALRAVGAFRPAEGLGPSRAALDDDDTEVRDAALHAVRAFDPEDLATLARRMLGDPSDAVVSTALFTLQNTGGMTVADLLPLTTAADPRTRTSALYHLRHADGDPTAALAAGLDDPDPHVRVSAIQTILRRKVDALRPRLVALREAETHPMVLSNLRHVTP
jgi:HEAT repeat protein